MARLYWRVTVNGKRTWRPVEVVCTSGKNWIVRKYEPEEGSE